jgi:hypothetical protein
MARIPSDQAWFWTREWQAMEREADEACAAGQYSAFEDMEELIASLRVRTNPLRHHSETRPLLRRG